MLLQKFFLVYNNWDWKRSPIMLNKVKDGNQHRNNVDGGMAETRKIWRQEENPRDMMPMITPAYPASNSSYTVSEFTLGAPRPFTLSCCQDLS